jgi:hypothetical protein
MGSWNHSFFRLSAYYQSQDSAVGNIYTRVAEFLVMNLILQHATNEPISTPTERSDCLSHRASGVPNIEPNHFMQNTVGTNRTKMIFRNSVNR